MTSRSRSTGRSHAVEGSADVGAVRRLISATMAEETIQVSAQGTRRDLSGPNCTGVAKVRGTRQPFQGDRRSKGHEGQTAGGFR